MLGLVAIRVICPLTNFFCYKAGSLDRCHVKQDPASVNQNCKSSDKPASWDAENIKGSPVPRICVNYSQDAMLTLQVIPSEWKRFDAMNLPLVTGFLRDRDTARVYNRIRGAAWVFVPGRSDVRQWQKLDWPSGVRVTCLAGIAVTRVTVLTKSVTGSEEAGNEYRRKSTGEVVQSVPQWVRSGGLSHVTASFSPLCPMPWDASFQLCLITFIFSIPPPN